MAKCPVCNSRKGKRKCAISDGHVCSLCCGQIRKEAVCQGCSFFKKPELKRNYSEIPSFSTRQMESDIDLQDYSNVIEGAICALDREHDNTLSDTDAVRLLELLIDRYHFKDETIAFDNPFIESCFHYMTGIIEEDLCEISPHTLVKILGVIRFVARRRSQGGREYMKVINDLVGIRVQKGVRVVKFRNLSG